MSEAQHAMFGGPNRGRLSHFSVRAARKNGDLGQLLEVDSPRITLAAAPRRAAGFPDRRVTLTPGVVIRFSSGLFLRPIVQRPPL